MPQSLSQIHPVLESRWGHVDRNRARKMGNAKRWLRRPGQPEIEKIERGVDFEDTSDDAKLVA